MSKTPTYEKAYIDFDTVLYRAAKSVQQETILVSHIPTGDNFSFSGVTEFRGRKKYEDGGWIYEQNLLRKDQNLPLYKREDFVVTPIQALKDVPADKDNLVEWAMELIDYKVGAIKKAMDSETYVLGIGGATNFRFEAAHIKPYKGQRPPKPLIFESLREAFVQKYKNKVSVSREGMEQDDEISIRGWESYFHHQRTGKWKYVLGYIDKDLIMTPCPHWNYDKAEEGIVVPTINECCLAFCCQLLTGDVADNIQGLPDIPNSLREEYGIRKGKGCGKETALKLLGGCSSPVEMFTNVVVAYKAYYGLEPFLFVSHRGVEMERTWLDMLKENALLLYMMRKPHERYDIENTFKRLGVEY